MILHQCSNPTSWHPTMHTHQNHHHPPLSWRRELAEQGRVDEPWWATIALCGLCHDEYHTLLNAYVRAGTTPPYEVTRTYSVYLKKLVAQAWERRPQGKLPYTVMVTA